MSTFLFSDCKSGDWAVVPDVELGQRIARGLGVTDYVIEPEPRDALEPFTYKPPYTPLPKVSDRMLDVVVGLAVVLSFVSGALFATGYWIGKIWG